jgi:Cd2+/Zn2+-exporting ATPase
MGFRGLQKDNYKVAMVFNLLAVVGSSLGYLEPVTGALAHNLGSVLVVINSTRLIR